MRSSRLLTRYAERHPAELAIAVARGGAAGVGALLDSLPEAARPAVVVHLPPDLAQDLMDRSPDARLVRWLAEADLATAVRLARRLAPLRRAGLAAQLPRRRQRDLDRSCSFPEGSVGAHMEVTFGSVSEAASVGDAAQALGPQSAPSPAPLVVVDAEGRLLGWLDAQKALRLGPAGSVRDCVIPARPVRAGADLRDARREFAARSEAWIPVVDAGSRPIGLLRRSRLPDDRAAPAPAAPAVLPALAATMLSLLGELPALVSGERREP